MKKIGLICLALVLALGGLGVGYAAWTDTVTIDGTVTTGEVCLSIQDGSYHEVGGYPADSNWAGWAVLSFPDPTAVSCPPGYKFTWIGLPSDPKDVATVSFVEILDADDDIVELEVTIHDAYPHLLVDISFWVKNCGTIPLKIKAPVITQSNYLLIEYGDNIGAQIHPEVSKEISFRVGVVQHEGYWDESVPPVWVVDDISQPLLPQNNTSDITFTITIEGIQWNEY